MNIDAVSLKFLPEEFLGSSRGGRSDRDDPDDVPFSLQIDRQLRAAPFGSAGVDFGDEQIDFHSASWPREMHRREIHVVPEPLEKLKTSLVAADFDTEQSDRQATE